ncbi:hypothetical protein J4231_01070 [Candidatus Woesearchaeota archaeon]|nr:hypothetical protein [Candidatus Woesearchaeota archaeon]
MAYEFLDNSIGLLLKWNNPNGDSPYGLIVLTFILTIIVVIIYKYASNQEALKRLREDSIRISQEMKEHKDNPAKVMELQKEQFQKGFFEQFKHTLKPMIITIIPMGIVFIYLRDFYTKIGNPKLMLGFGWIFVYIIFSIAFNMVLRKILKVY